MQLSRENDIKQTDDNYNYGPVPLCIILFYSNVNN